LIVAPWGRPATWEDADYVLDQAQKRSCTSLGMVADYFNDADVAILALDSLVDEYNGRPIEGKCYTCYDMFRNTIREAASKQYSELLTSLERFVKQFVKCLGISRTPIVIICPAIGSPGGRWKFIGSPSDFEAAALYRLGKLCIENAYSRIVLDLTHGVNFMPAVTLKLAGELASLILAAHGEFEKSLENGVELRVYNSDPLAQTSGIAELNLNLVTKDRIKTILVPHQLARKLLRQRVKGDSLKAEIDKLNNEYWDTVRLPLSTIYYPLPLALCEIVLESSNHSPVQILDTAFKLWCERVSVSNTCVERTLELDPEAVYALLLTEALHRWLMKMGVSTPLSLEVLEKLAKFYKLVNESFYYLIMDEKHRIERSTCRPSEWIPLSQLVYDAKEMTPNKRIMIAHAGLQKEFVEINKNTRQLKYRMDAKVIVDSADLLLKTPD